MVGSYDTTVTSNTGQSLQKPSRFLSQSTGCMELHADAQTVTKYLDAHRDWFCHCAHPMKVEPVGDNGYTLTIGRFSSFGYEVEPKISLDLLPQDQRGYCIQTIPTFNPDQNYTVDFQAALQLSEAPTHLMDKSAEMPQTQLTRVEWQLNLAITIQFPKFIQKLPQSVVQQTGDCLLANVVHQISQRLTIKVHENFHSTLSLTVPKQLRKKHLFGLSKLQATDL